jgi:tetratricopeptide (TPR) repeat protein
VRSFFLFALLSHVLGNPLVALAVVLAVVYLADARWNGRWFDPPALLKRRQAIRELRQTVERNEHNAAAHNDLGRLLAQQGDYRGALPHMERAMRRMEEAPETNFYYGLCLLNTGRREEGERSVRRSLEINPRFLYGEPQTLLARTNLEHNDVEEGRRWAREAVKLNTSSVEGWVLLGRAEERRGDAAAAREAFTQAKNAYKHLPAYLHLPNRKWLVAAKRGERNSRA